MNASERSADGAAIGSVARCFAALATAVAVTLGPGFLGNGQAAGDLESSLGKGLVSAAYFSEACRHEAELLGIARAADAQVLVAAFAQSLAADAPDARAERRAGSFDVRSGSAGCDPPAVALINLLRLNGVAAELVLVSMLQARSAGHSAFTDRLDSVLVYVPALGRYIDPAATDMRENAAFDRVIKETAVRGHLIGPAPYADPALDACGDVCMSEYWPRHDPYVVRVRTEAIRGP